MGEAPSWYIPLGTVRAGAEYLGCSVVEFLRDCAPGLRQKAIMAVRAEAAARQQRRGTAFDGH